MAGQFFCDEEVKISLCSEVLTTNTHYSMFNTTFIAWSPQRVLLFSILKIHFLQTCWQEIRCVCRRLLEFSTTAHPTTASTTPPTTATTTSTPFQHLPTRLPSPRHPSFLTSNPLPIASAERSTEAAWPLIGQAPGTLPAIGRSSGGRGVHSGSARSASVALRGHK